jgi:hypothetical protein
MNTIQSNASARANLEQQRCARVLPSRVRFHSSARRVARFSTSTSKKTAKNIFFLDTDWTKKKKKKNRSEERTEEEKEKRMNEITKIATSALAVSIVCNYGVIIDVAHACASSEHAMDPLQVFDVAMAGEDIPFWANMAKYARFSISIMVGFVYMFARPVAKLMKDPKTAVLVVVGFVGAFQFFKFTIEEMLAVNG